MRDLLQRLGVPVRLEVVDGQQHSFDYERDAENKHETIFDEVKRFLEAHLGTAAKKRRSHLVSSLLLTHITSL
jgi:acetyl esterase/lipase